MKPAILVIDMIVDFVTGKFGNPYAQKIVPVIKDLLEFSRNNKIPIFYLTDSHSPNDPEISLWGEHAMENDEGAQIIADLSPKEGDYVIKKKVYSGFFGTDLENKLRNLGIDTVVLTGTSTHICVQHNACDAFYRGFKVIVVSDAVASFVPEEHERALKYMKDIYGAEIITSKEIKERIMRG
ncbi:MAG: nicotinamidase [Dictyoglomus sp. NZ13-RE01]|nr:MAG: nicotinamidase [Dictyoglomus sp. NZ13-RE01]